MVAMEETASMTMTKPHQQDKVVEPEADIKKDCKGDTDTADGGDQQADQAAGDIEIDDPQTHTNEDTLSVALGKEVQAAMEHESESDCNDSIGNEIDESVLMQNIEAAKSHRLFKTYRAAVLLEVGLEEEEYMFAEDDAVADLTDFNDYLIRHGESPIGSFFSKATQPQGNDDDIIVVFKNAQKHSMFNEYVAVQTSRDDPFRIPNFLSRRDCYRIVSHCDLMTLWIWIMIHDSWFMIDII